MLNLVIVKSTLGHTSFSLNFLNNNDHLYCSTGLQENIFMDKPRACGVWKWTSPDFFRQARKIWQNQLFLTFESLTLHLFFSWQCKTMLFIHKKHAVTSSERAHSIMWYKQKSRRNRWASKQVLQRYIFYHRALLPQMIACFELWSQFRFLRLNCHKELNKYRLNKSLNVHLRMNMRFAMHLTI